MRRTHLLSLMKLTLREILLDAPDAQEAAETHLAELRAAVFELEEATAAALAREQRLLRELAQHDQEAARWDTQTDADLLSGAGDDAARAALKRATRARQASETTRQALTRQQSALADLRHDLATLRTRFAEAERYVAEDRGQA